jgi:hypothetical protein
VTWVGARANLAELKPVYRNMENRLRGPGGSNTIIGDVSSRLRVLLFNKVALNHNCGRGVTGTLEKTGFVVVCHFNQAEPWDRTSYCFSSPQS